MLDSLVAEVCQRVSASQAACPVSIAEEGFCNCLIGMTALAALGAPGGAFDYQMHFENND